MKVKFEFDTNAEDFYDSFDHIKLYQMQIADSMARALNDMREAIRSELKYTDHTSIDLDKLQDKFFEIINEHDINFEKLGYLEVYILMNTEFPNSLSDIEKRLEELFKTVRVNDLQQELDTADNFARFVHRIARALSWEFGFAVKKLYQDEVDAIYKIAFNDLPTSRIIITLSRIEGQYKVDARSIQ